MITSTKEPALISSKEVQNFLVSHQILRIGRHNENYNIYRTPGTDGYERFGCGKTVAEALENAQ